MKKFLVESQKSFRIFSILEVCVMLEIFVDWQNSTSIEFFVLVQNVILNVGLHQNNLHLQQNQTQIPFKKQTSQTPRTLLQMYQRTESVMILNKHKVLVLQ